VRALTPRRPPQVAHMTAARFKVLIVLGTRPEAIKLWSPIQALRERDDLFETTICSTGQHRQLLDGALATFGIVPDYRLAVMRDDQDPGEVATAVASDVAGVLRAERPAVVLVQGDTTTAMAAGLAAFYHRTLVGHIEAGLRTYDNACPWPEEGHRRILGAIADLHFAPSQLAVDNLLREGVARGAVYLTGNTGIDALQWALNGTDPSARHVEPCQVVVTVHRRESLGAGIVQVFAAVATLAREFPDVHFYCVLHPNPRVLAAVPAGLGTPIPSNVELVGSLDYVSFVRLIARSQLVMTDSGGIQEEAPVLGVPVIVLKEHTARREPVSAGTALTAPTDVDGIVEAASAVLSDGALRALMGVRHSPYGDGRAGERIVATLADVLERACQDRTLVR
jgi:UDP-N-acetylglucosamine 2-epimerase (non-hydrolysing)